MKRSYAQSEASLSDSDAGPRSSKRACRQQPQQQQQQQQQRYADQSPASPENPHKLIEVAVPPRRHEELSRASSIADLLPLVGDESSSSAPDSDDASGLAVIVPRCTAWFQYRRVHRIERLAFPQFFANESGACRNQRLYVAYRNCMIDSYRADPRRHFSLGACSRRLPGDIRQLAAVHAFLEQWGLINLQAIDGDCRLPFEDSADTAVPFHLLRLADPSGNVLLPLDAPGIEGTLQQGLAESSDSAPPAAEEEPPAKPTPPGVARLRPEQYAPLAPELRSVGGRRNDWTDAELLSLLEGVELYKEDWGRVAERVGGGRTQEECIVQMLKLPILDPYLDGAEQALGPLAERLEPFGDAANPVMCTVAFLAAAVDPRVASAAALSALDKYGRLAEAEANADAERQAATLRSAAGDIAASLLPAAAEKSDELGRVELCKMRALALLLVEAQMKKLEVKLRHYQELDAFVDKERECFEAQLQQVHLERQCFHQELMRTAEAAAPSSSSSFFSSPSL